MKPFLVFLLCVFSICCFRAIEPVQVVTPEEPPEPEQFCSPIEGPTEIRTDGHVSLENVSFSYVPNWIEKVEYSVIPECVLIRNDYKPDPIGGRTLQFNLHYSASEEEATILIFKIADYKNAFAKYPQFVENRDAELLAIINGGSRLKRYGLEPPPHVTWMDAGQSFYSRAKKIDFIGGHGIFTVTDISNDTLITVANSNLLFLFQGFTTDGIYFVEMNIPAKLNGFPEEADEFPNGSNKPNYDSREHLKAWQKYLLKTAARIDKASSSDFQPNAAWVEKFIRGFQIKS